MKLIQINPECPRFRISWPPAAPSSKSRIMSLAVTLKSLAPAHRALFSSTARLMTLPRSCVAVVAILGIRKLNIMGM
jgi:hypothetical protein